MTLIEALAGAVGLLLGVGGAITLDMLDSGFTTPREIEEKLGQPVLSSVPLLGDKERTDRRQNARTCRDISLRSRYRVTPKRCERFASESKWPTSTIPPR